VGSMSMIVLTLSLQRCSAILIPRMLIYGKQFKRSYRHLPIQLLQLLYYKVQVDVTDHHSAYDDECSLPSGKFVVMRNSRKIGQDCNCILVIV
jgi:hypothetical protein